MNSNATGGTAFPIDLSNTGMTLRDYFAAKALQSFAGLKAAPVCKEEYERLAETAYRMADAMVETRK